MMPALASVSRDRWLVSNAIGQLFSVQLARNASRWTAQVSQAIRIIDKNGVQEQDGQQLQSAHASSDGTILMILTRTAKRTGTSDVPFDSPSRAPEVSSARHRGSPTRFQFACFQLKPEQPFDAQNATELWRLGSATIPHLVNYCATLNRFVIGAGTALEFLEQFLTDQQQVERESIPRIATGQRQQTSVKSYPPLRPSEPAPPFSWLQDADSLTVVFAVPSDLPTSSIRLTFSRQFLSLHIGSARSGIASSDDSHTLPRVSHKRLWDTIDPHTSVWTFDREAEGRDTAFGLLTLHLEKATPGLKWMDVFADTRDDTIRDVAELGSTQGSTAGVFTGIKEQQALEGVAETVDPSELASISEKMAQWTQTSLPSSVVDDGVGHGVPTSLSGEEIDVEVDASSGRPLIVTWVEDSNSQTPRLVCPHSTIPFALISTALPLGPRIQEDSAVVVKHDVDGLLFTPPLDDSQSYVWRHISTFPAIAFVLATKRDARFVYHVGRDAVLAFDSPSAFSLVSPLERANNGGGNLFVYYRPPGVKEKIGNQRVFRIGGPSSGSLMGVAGYRKSDGAIHVLALCEHEIVTIRLM